MRARGRGMTWWARTAQKSGSRLMPNAAMPVWLSSAFKVKDMAPEKIGSPEAPGGGKWWTKAMLVCAPGSTLTTAGWG